VAPHSSLFFLLSSSFFFLLSAFCNHINLSINPLSQNAPAAETFGQRAAAGSSCCAAVRDQ
jgi:hypothetical protein